tara:strand:- start:327 stop:584 length:258 start_codon:yes stop_codon:yes gene_type:complete
MVTDTYRDTSTSASFLRRWPETDIKTNDKTSQRGAAYRARVKAGIYPRSGVAFDLLVSNLISLNPGMEIGVIRQFAREIGAGYHL